MISYVLPGWFYYNLHKDEDNDDDDNDGDNSGGGVDNNNNNNNNNNSSSSGTTATTREGPSPAWRRFLVSLSYAQFCTGVALIPLSLIAIFAVRGGGGVG
jgi:hypothetical protein